ncbi:MAG: radical SAM protein [Suilimivivens sp.]
MNDLYVSLILTQRCNAKCKMCNSHLYPTKPEEEFTVDLIKKLPKMQNVTLTGGEPFLRRDIEDIIKELEKKSNRILINTNGYYTKKIVDVCSRHPQVGIRISLDGLKETHNRIRGVHDMYEHVMNTINQLEEVRGKKDLGVGFCVQESNYTELFAVFEWAQKRKYEFGVSVIHNSAYYHKDDNTIESEDNVICELEKLKKGYLEGFNVKNWGRAFFVEGAIKYVKNQKKPMKCDAGKSSFFITPQGNVLPCNDFPQEMIMGNLNESTWDEIMHSDDARKTLHMCKRCNLNCWSICNMGSKFRKNILIIGLWTIWNKIVSLVKTHK